MHQFIECIFVQSNTGLETGLQMSCMVQTVFMVRLVSLLKQGGFCALFWSLEQHKLDDL